MQLKYQSHQSKVHCANALQKIGRYCRLLKIFKAFFPCAQPLRYKVTKRFSVTGNFAVTTHIAINYSGAELKVNL